MHYLQNVYNWTERVDWEVLKLSKLSWDRYKQGLDYNIRSITDSKNFSISEMMLQKFFDPLILKPPKLALEHCKV